MVVASGFKKKLEHWIIRPHYDTNIVRLDRDVDTSLLCLEGCLAAVYVSIYLPIKKIIIKLLMKNNVGSMGGKNKDGGIWFKKTRALNY